MILPSAARTGDIADHDEENLLGEVGGFVTKPRDTAEPAADERPIDVLQAEPSGVVRSSCLESIEKADGSRVHGRSSMEVQPASPLSMDASYSWQNPRRLQRASFLVDQCSAVPSSKLRVPSFKLSRSLLLAGCQLLSLGLQFTRNSELATWSYLLGSVLRSSVHYDLACPSAKAESNSRPADLNPIFSLTKRAASAAPYSRSMPQSSHSTESGPS